MCWWQIPGDITFLCVALHAPIGYGGGHVLVLFTVRLHYHHICSAALLESFEELFLSLSTAEEPLSDESVELGINYMSSTIYPCDITDYGDIGPVRFEESFCICEICS